jgi:hypothetical protein
MRLYFHCSILLLSLSILRPVADELALSYGNRIVGESVRRPSETSVLTSVQDVFCRGNVRANRRSIDKIYKVIALNNYSSIEQL